MFTRVGHSKKTMLIPKPRRDFDEFVHESTPSQQCLKFLDITLYYLGNPSQQKYLQPEKLYLIKTWDYHGLVGDRLPWWYYGVQRICLHMSASEKGYRTKEYLITMIYLLTVNLGCITKQLDYFSIIEICCIYVNHIRANQDTERPVSLSFR